MFIFSLLFVRSFGSREDINQTLIFEKLYHLFNEQANIIRESVLYCDDSLVAVDELFFNRLVFGGPTGLLIDQFIEKSPIDRTLPSQKKKY